MFQPDFTEIDSRQPANWRDYLVPQDWQHFTAQEHGVWDTLFARQVPYLGSRIVTPFLEGIPRLGLDQRGIPNLDLLNQRLEELTGWRCVSVPGLVPDDAFFAMLAERCFPIGNFIRSAGSLDYLEEPDCFHDIFGHVPLLAHEPVARLMQAMGTPGRGGHCSRPGRHDFAALLAYLSNSAWPAKAAK
jgi:phenylalanine-4-hydroxylase